MARWLGRRRSGEAVAPSSTPLRTVERVHLGDGWASYREVNDAMRAMADDSGDWSVNYTWPQYAWGVLHASRQARALGFERITAIEFGVAGGNGLRTLETVAALACTRFGVAIEVFGFDTGVGMPASNDPRDLPNLFGEGDFAMDVERLSVSLRNASLVLGRVTETVPTFLSGHPAPIGFISFDLDTYNATVAAFAVLAAPVDALMPRVHCYFDDVVGFTYGDCNGERLAIREFNQVDPQRQISPLYGLRHFVASEHFHDMWPSQMFLAHVLDHPRYADDDGLASNRQFPLH